MSEKMFSLLREPWIRVIEQGGREKEVSLPDLFEQAHQLQGLAGELPGQDAAMLRFLLAVLYAVFVRKDSLGRDSPVTDMDTALDRWAELWERRSFPADLIRDYLNEHEERFYLLHPENPFYQVNIASIAQVHGPDEALSFLGSDNVPIYATIKSAGALLGDCAESGNKIRLFTSRTERKILSFSEAARWLLYLNAFDAAPAGTSRTEDGRLIKGYGLGWLAQLGLVWASGTNLFETLMLNLVLGGEEISWESCRPVWETNAADLRKDLETIDPPFPRDLCALYTTQFRRVTLLTDPENSGVTGFRLWSGQKLETKNCFLEPMTVWRKTKDGYYPKRHDPSRQMWRDFAPIFLGEADGHRKPGILSWLARINMESLTTLPLLTLHIAGVTYVNNTAVEHIFSDSLSINRSVMLELDKVWVRKISEVVEDSAHLVVRLAILARDLNLAGGGTDNSGEIEKAVEQAYFRLDEPFRTWIESIDEQDAGDRDRKCEEWRKECRKILGRLARELAADAGHSAYIGRTYTVSEQYEGSLRRSISNSVLQGSELRMPSKSTASQAQVSRRYAAPELLNRYFSRRY